MAKNEFQTKEGERKIGKLINAYRAFEGGERFVFETPDGKEYRCIINEKGEYIEYRP